MIDARIKAAILANYGDIVDFDSGPDSDGFFSVPSGKDRYIAGIKGKLLKNGLVHVTMQMCLPTTTSTTNERKPLSAELIKKINSWS
jgi:hypothetical protein